jgi:type 1 glutamine amidotransferase
MPSHRRSAATVRFALAAALLGTIALGAERPIRVLIVDGQNNHQWATTTPLLKRILEESGRFVVDVSTTPPAKPPPPRLGKEATAEQKAAHPENLKKYAALEAEHAARAPALWAKWRPKFSDYAVVLSNYNGERWPDEVRAAFTAFVRAGGGFVSYHAANNAFPDWPEYNEMIGVGGWGNRDEKSGPYLRLRAGKWIQDMAAGRGGAHGPQLEFVIEAQVADHPVMRGLPARWMHAKDELYESLRGPAKNVVVLASAFSERTKEHEPMLMAIPFGQGRVFHTAIGHAVDAINGLGFQLTLLRGTEWAATGRVTQPAPPAGALPVERAALRPVNR